MCLKYIKIKNRSSSLIPTYSYVPCGKCADCRAQEQIAWKSRLLTEFESLRQKGWSVGFCTLTYSPDCLPTIPLECFVNPLDYKEIPCFDIEGCRKFIKDLRQYCKYHYGYKNGDNMRYFMSSEYGTLYHRPHHHLVLAWNGSISYEQMHGLIKRFWKFGLVGPKHYNGDSRCGAFELVGDYKKALAYVCKYVAKDIDYVNEIDGIDFYSNPRDFEEGTPEREKARKFFNCRPIHLQSVSLGFEPIRELTFDEKLDLLADGISFIGDSVNHSLSMYVKKKLLFDNYYEYVDGERKVRRVASEFFEKYHDRIFEKKAGFYDDYLSKLSRSYLDGCGIDSKLSCELSDILQFYRSNVESRCVDFDLSKMGQLYLAYHQIQQDRCYDIPLSEQFMLRYRYPNLVKEAATCNKWKLVNSSQISWLEQYWEFCDQIYYYINIVKLSDRSAIEAQQKKLLDFWNFSV